MRDPLPIVCKLGDQFDQDRLGWQKKKALVLLVALSGPWNGGAAQLADALGIHPDLQEQIHAEAAAHTLTYPQPIPDTLTLAS